jgi:hypothetical protein
VIHCIIHVCLVAKVTLAKFNGNFSFKGDIHIIIGMLSLGQ